MEIEITVTWTRSTRVQVPEVLCPAQDSDGWKYPDRDKFEEFVCSEAENLCTSEGDSMGHEPNDWLSTEAYETESWNEVYSCS